MKILIYGLNYWPEPIGVGKYTGELAEWLASRGHEIRVATAYPYYPSWTAPTTYQRAWYRREHRAGVAIYRCPIWVPTRPNGMRRILHLLSFAVSSGPVAAWMSWLWRPDIVLGVVPTLFTAPASLIAGRLGGARAWLHIQDFEFDAAFAVGLIKSDFMRLTTQRIEASLLRRFHRVSSISPQMCRRLVEKGIAESSVKFLPNWIATDEIFPLETPSPLRQELAIEATTTVALYSGNMNEKQGLDRLIDAAKLLQGRSNILFILAGEGPSRARLERLAAGLVNVRFLPLQPAERLNELLNLADIHMLPQKRGTANLVMPSKMIGMMASGRPIVAGAAPLTDVAKTASGCGIVVPPEDGGAMAQAIVTLADDAGLRKSLGAAGRQQALAIANRDAILSRLERWFEESDQTIARPGSDVVLPT